MKKTDLKMKTELSSLYGRSASMLSTPLYIVASLTDEEIIQKVRKQIRFLFHYIINCDVTSEMYQYGRVEGMLYGLFAADRLSMEDYEKFSYVIECMDNEFYRRY